MLNQTIAEILENVMNNNMTQILLKSDGCFHDKNIEININGDKTFSITNDISVNNYPIEDLPKYLESKLDKGYEIVEKYIPEELILRFRHHCNIPDSVNMTIKDDKIGVAAEFKTGKNTGVYFIELLDIDKFEPYNFKHKNNYKLEELRQKVFIPKLRQEQLLRFREQYSIPETMELSIDGFEIKTKLPLTIDGELYEETVSLCNLSHMRPFDFKTGVNREAIQLISLMDPREQLQNETNLYEQNEIDAPGDIGE